MRGLHSGIEMFKVLRSRIEFSYRDTSEHIAYIPLFTKDTSKRPDMGIFHFIPHPDRRLR